MDYFECIVATCCTFFLTLFTGNSERHFNSIATLFVMFQFSIKNLSTHDTLLKCPTYILYASFLLNRKRFQGLHSSLSLDWNFRWKYFFFFKSAVFFVAVCPIINNKRLEQVHVFNMRTTTTTVGGKYL